MLQCAVIIIGINFWETGSLYFTSIPVSLSVWKKNQNLEVHFGRIRVPEDQNSWRIKMETQKQDIVTWKNNSNECPLITWINSYSSAFLCLLMKLVSKFWSFIGTNRYPHLSLHNKAIPEVLEYSLFHLLTPDFYSIFSTFYSLHSKVLSRPQD